MKATFQDFENNFTDNIKDEEKKVLRSFLTKDEEKSAWEHDKTIFIFDTNVLLRLYDYDKYENLQNFLNILRGLQPKIWLPHQVGLEFYKNREECRKKLFNNRFILPDEHKFFKFQEGTRDFLVKNLTETKTNELASLFEDGGDFFKKILDKLNECYNEFKISPDKVLDNIEEIFENKVGTHFSQDELNQIYEEGEKRYENKIPPGFNDASSKRGQFYSFNGIKYNAKFGDLILWKQIIDKSKDNDIKNVIFITNDGESKKKNDWLIKDGDKQYPRFELIEEIKKQANVELFHMYTTDSFLDALKEFRPDIELSNESIESIKQINSFEEKLQELKEFEEELKEFEEESEKESREFEKMKIFINKKKEFFMKERRKKLKRNRIVEVLQNYQDDNCNDDDENNELDEDELYEEKLANVYDRHKLKSRAQAEHILELEEKDDEDFYN